LFIIFIVGLYLIKINLWKEEDSSKAEKGRMDLQEWGLKKNIKLDGEWEFYPGVFLEPGGIQNKDLREYEQIKKYVQIPGPWNTYLNEDGSADGAGTYRLVIKVPEDRVYAIKTRTIRMASRVYLNGQATIRMGNPSINREDFERDSKYRVGAGNSLNREIELILHVSNYDYKVGGIIKSIEFGTFESIMKVNNKDRALDVLMIAVCLTLCVHFLIIYSQRKKEPYLAYFSGMSFFMAMYLSIMNEQVLDLVYNYNYETRIAIQVTSMIMVTACLTKFTHYFFKNTSKNKLIHQIPIIIFIALAILRYNPNDPIFIYKRFLHVIFLGVLMVRYGHIFYILLKEIYNKSDSSEYILTIITTMCSYWFIMVLKIIFEVDLGNIAVLLILLLMLSIASLMSHRLQLDYQNVIALSEKQIRYDRLKDEFLAKASHELRTPLHVILNLAKNLLEGKKGTLNARQQEELFFIHREGQRLTRLVEDLLDASQIKKGEIRLRLQSVEPYKIVEDILKEMKILIPENSSILLKNKIPSTFPAMRADSDKFRQIIYNLVHNAIKYTKDGEIVVSASAAAEQIEITVSDTGIGIEKESLKEVFEIFYQRNGEGQAEQGLGLGLSIVKHLVESQGGTIEVESVYGKGSCFRFTLPIDDDAVENQSEIAAAEEARVQAERFADSPPKLLQEKKNNLGKPMILIVDDEFLNQRILLDIVRQLGFNGMVADSGKETLEILEREKVDLIILDLMLPDMSGDRVCSIIRQKYSMGELPILILTASGRAADLMNAFDYGANDFQRKPMDSEELKSRIQSLLLMKKSVEEDLEKEFQYFFSQISPHFLYNTINTIIGLSYMDSEKVRDALNNLSIYFRGKLDVHRKNGLISLKSELELITAYLQIEKMRFDERLILEFDLEEDLKAMIPPLTLQPIVENSVHHSISAKNDTVTIRITAKREEKGFIRIGIEDNGIGMTLEKQKELLGGNSQRIGLSNVMEKIKRLKGATLVLDSKPGAGTKVEITIPEVMHGEGYFS